MKRYIGETVLNALVYEITWAVTSKVVRFVLR